MKPITSRTYFGIGFIICLLLLGAAYYFEFIRGMMPCLLCVLQRWAIILLGIIFLIATLHNPKTIGIRIYGFFILFVSVLGALAAGRQVWLQHQPLPVEETCLPGLQFLLKTHPLHEVVKIMAKGDTQCAKISWQFLTLSMPQWTLVTFLFFVLLGLRQIFRKGA